MTRRTDSLMGEMEERPASYLGPNLDPRGLVLQPRELGAGVFALLANTPPKDNNGLIAGSRAALVVDAGVNGDVSRQIQGLVASLTHRPLRYLVNTTYHGDHTFGNYAFPDDVVVISSRQNRAGMTDLGKEKRVRTGNLRGNTAALQEVVWRLPDVVFDGFASVDLGDREVELWHFGPGNGPGDVVVFEPRTRTAWTGNFLMRAGIPPMLLEGGPRPYIGSLRRMRERLDVDTIVPGHGPTGDGRQAIDSMIEYLSMVDEGVRVARGRGLTLEQTLEAVSLPGAWQVPPEAPAAAEMGPLAFQLHRLNLLATYRELERAGS